MTPARTGFTSRARRLARPASRRPASGRIAAAISLVLLAPLLAACTGPTTDERADTTWHDGSGVLTSSAVSTTLASLPRSGTTVANRSAEGAPLPTNRWYSGLVFGPRPQPVFPLPLSFRLQEDGFSVGVPTPAATADLVAAPAVDDLTVRIAGGADPKVVRDDGVSVTVGFSHDGQRTAEVTIARGSPTVTVVARGTLRLESSLPFATSGGATLARGAHRWVLGGDGSTAKGGSISVAKGSAALITAVPDGKSPARIARAAGGVVAVTTEYAVDHGRARTRLGYRSASGGSTLFAATPLQTAAVRGVQCDLGDFSTVSGTMRLCSGRALTWSVAARTPAFRVDLARLSAADRATIVDQLGRDAVPDPGFEADTYGGGKRLARLAALVELARGLGSPGEAADRRLSAELDAELEAWTEPSGCRERSIRCFTYDAHVGGVVGLAASYGSDQFNDHHFHYGYFLYAAAVAAQNDPAVERRLAPVMNAVAADLASGTRTSRLPARRVFDAFSGHSWASGYSPFADGNNQESSSEAVNAWNGLALWARVTGETGLETEARWMLSSEIASARADWLGVDTGAVPYASGADDGYAHPVVGIVWDGKLDWATWFSAADSSKVAIQLLPLPPVEGAVNSDPAVVRRVVAAAGGTDAATFPDYLLMYSALESRTAADRALAAAEALPDSSIDPGNSRTELLAWIMSARSRLR